MSYGKIIQKVSVESGLTPDLIAAVIYEESRGDQWACRYEPGFFTKYLEGKRNSQIPGYWPKDTPPTISTEMRLRSCSFGLMQIMGQVAREYNFEDRYLTSLFDPVVNISLGAKILAHKMKTGGTFEKGLLRWNGGSDKEYPDRIKGWIKNGVANFILSPVSVNH